MAQRENDGCYSDVLGGINIALEGGSSESKAMNGPSGFTYRDADALKLFVGQIPKHMNEDELRPIFDEFGEIFDLAVIRDKNSGLHRGCAFLTYCARTSAETAIANLHGRKILEWGQNPLQVRPAEGQAEQENKLFVGMLPRSVNEDDIRKIFELYGTVREIHVIRTQGVVNKGCAFVKYTTHKSALAAIEALHNRRRVRGSSRALVVKFADNRRKAQGQTENLSIGSPDQSSMRLQPSSMGWPGHSVEPLGDNLAYSPPAISLVRHMPSGMAYPPHCSARSSAVPSQDNEEYRTSTPTGFDPAGVRADGYSSMAWPKPVWNDDKDGGGRHLQSFLGFEQDSRSHDIITESKSAEGPPGTNLLIYHLPRDLSDADLATAFAPFGNVLSSKVCIDHGSGESKGFGFVSYSEPHQAELAIERMNGFQIGSKRLKVQHKCSGQFAEDTDEHSGDEGGEWGYGNGEYYNQDITGHQDAKWEWNSPASYGGDVGASYSSLHSSEQSFSALVSEPWDMPSSGQLAAMSRPQSPAVRQQKHGFTRRR